MFLIRFSLIAWLFYGLAAYAGLEDQMRPQPSADPAKSAEQQRMTVMPENNSTMLDKDTKPSPDVPSTMQSKDANASAKTMPDSKSGQVKDSEDDEETDEDFFYEGS